MRDIIRVIRIISGLIGAASYERVVQPNLAFQYWDAFNVGLAVAVGAILIGGTIQLITMLLDKRKEESGGAE